MLPLFDSPEPQTLVEKVSHALRDGSRVVAASARAARFLRQAYAEQQRASGLEMWASPRISDWESWITELWQELTFVAPEPPLLLGPIQERFLWKQVQREDAGLVVSPDGMASLAQDAYALLSAYRKHDARRFPWDGPDAERFRKWAADFDDLCRSRNWASRSKAEELLADAVRSGVLRVSENLFLVGFDRLTPKQERLIAVLRETGSRVESPGPGPYQDCTGRQVAADDLRDELLACAQWCRHQLEKKGAKRIGVIAPDLHSIRAEADRVFRAVLMPESLDITKGAGTPAYEFSLGLPLADVPVIRAALLMLRWTTRPLQLEEVTWLTLSGFFCKHPAEVGKLAWVDLGLRRSGLLSPEISLDGFLKKTGPGAFRTRLLRIQRMLEKDDARKTPLTYAGHCEMAEALLRAARWPGFHHLDSVQYQARTRWQKLLDEMALLDFSGHRAVFKDFVQALELHASNTLFTPESRHAPVQIMGAFESSGQAFDAVWFLGADDSQWPVAGRPHPLLPLREQLQAQMPHCCAAVDTALALSVTQRIANSAPEFVFSYARSNKEGALRPSSLPAYVLGINHTPISTHALRAELQMGSATASRQELEMWIQSSEAVPWPRERVAGGAGILKEQAACPFQAFATRRLGALPLDRAAWGLNAMQRGNLVHAILEDLWSPETPEPFRMTGWNDLQRLHGAGRLDEVLRYHINAAFSELMTESAADPWMTAYLVSEQDRMQRSLKEWLECEARRQPFTVECREERLRDVCVGGLKLNLRADRIDLLPDDNRLLIDYKTGDVSTADWKGERMNEPQLPLYAVYGNVENVSGLLFARIRAGRIGFVGHVADPQQQLQSDLDAKSALMQQPYNSSMKQNWQQSLLGLAEEFLRGEASVDPKQGAKTCRYCPLPGLCRVAETQTTTQPEDPQDE